MGNPHAVDKPWTVIDRSQVFEYRPWVRVWKESIEISDSRTVDDFLTFEMPDHVVIVAVTETMNVLVSHNYKHGPRRQCINLPGGYLEPDEDAQVAAARELLEETGFASDAWTSLGQYASDGNRGAGKAFLFLATSAYQVADPIDVGDLEATTLATVPLTELVELVAEGDVAVLSNAAAIALAALKLTTAK